MTEETLKNDDNRDIAISLQVPADLVSKVDTLAAKEMRSRNKQFNFLIATHPLIAGGENG